MGAQTDVLDRSLERLRELDMAFAGGCTTLFASKLAIEELLPEVDLVIGAVLVPGPRPRMC